MMTQNPLRTLAVVALVALGGRSTFAQDATQPTPPPPVPAAAESVEDRLRKMEAMNQKLLEQFGTMAKQNEELSKTVKDLSQKLEATSGKKEDGEAKADAAPDPDDDSTPTTGGLESPPSATEKAKDAGKGKSKKIPVKTFIDQDYKKRYGFVLQSEDEEYEIRFNGFIQTDARIYGPVQRPVISDIDIPRARLYMSGRLTKPIEYQFSFQRTTNNFDLLNAYLNYSTDERFNVRVGRFRAPYTYEWAKLSNWEMPTPERAPFAANFGPNRQIGAMIWGNIFQNRLEYAVGILDGPRNSYQDFNSDKDVMAFLDWRPFFETDSKSPLKTFSVGGSVDAGNQNNPLVPALLRGSINGSQSTLSAAQGDNLIAVPFLAFNNNVRERGDRVLWELHSTYFYKQLAILAAWDGGRNGYSQTGRAARPVALPVGGFHIQGSYMLTGETREKITLIEPLRPFNLKEGSFGLGAIELQARYSMLEVGEEVFTQGLADPNLWTRRAEFVDAGFNWYFNRYVKMMFDWQHAMFAEPLFSVATPKFRKTNDLFWLRLQVYF